MEESILNEIRDIKLILAKLIGTADRSVENPFSEEELNKAAIDFHKISVERGEWVNDAMIKKYIKSAPDWNPGHFLRTHFDFSNWYKKGHDYLYSKRDLIALNEELVKRNIDLARYREMLEDKAAFERSLTRPKKPNKKTSGGKPFKMPDGIKNITTSPVPKPDADIVKQDLTKLKQEFTENNYAQYVDVYKGIHAMMKDLYLFRKYIATDIRHRCKKWCDDFNYANRALKEITGRMEKFNAPPDKNMLEL